jgi:hypothetical protein
MRFKGEPDGEATEEQLRHRIRGDLERLGVGEEVSPVLAQLLEERAAERSGPEYAALLEGVAATWAVEHSTHEELNRCSRELRELERLMQSFVGELGKLDEALEVLAAYLRRMRQSSAGRVAQTLH